MFFQNEMRISIFHTTAELFRIAFPKFESGEITFEELKKRLNLKNACELIDKAEKELEAKDERLKDIDTKTLTESVSAT
ncbi:MAG: hypothetical protein M3297_16780 [Thermoproteota archaeon]|nr:hypothetical protein [Thermoproteota archaeon]